MGGDNFVISVKNISVTNILTVKIGISETLFLCSPNDQHVFYILIFFRISIFDTKLLQKPPEFGGIYIGNRFSMLRCSLIRMKTQINIQVILRVFYSEFSSRFFIFAWMMWSDCGWLCGTHSVEIYWM